MFLLLCLIIFNNLIPSLGHNWTHTKQLDENYLIKWNFNDSIISFRAEVNTNGWFAIGLSSNGKMVGSDVAIGWIAPDGWPSFKV